MFQGGSATQNTSNFIQILFTWIQINEGIWANGSDNELKLCATNYPSQRLVSLVFQAYYTSWNIACFAQFVADKKLWYSPCMGWTDPICGFYWVTEGQQSYQCNIPIQTFEIGPRLSGLAHRGQNCVKKRLKPNQICYDLHSLSPSLTCLTFASSHNPL